MTDPSTPSSEPTGAADGDALVGTILAGRYRILRRLGRGAMGSVYLGEHLKFGRKDAIKVLQGGIAHDKEATDRFLRGARNASAINHPNVCTVYDFGDTDDGMQFLAMEFVAGECLSDILDREGPLPLRRALEITRQIGDALDAAHEMGIVHRDLKPGNVMLMAGRDGGDVVKVVDFDIAKGTSDGEGSEVTRTGFVVGTPEYMSPEQLIGDPLDGRSDVYSLALVFSRIVTGRLPVRSTSTQDLMVERLTQDPLRLAEIAPELLIPEGVQAAIDHALERRREDRPASSAAFVAELLRGSRADGSTGGRPAGVGSTAGRPVPGPAGPVPETRVAAPASAPGAAAAGTQGTGLRRLLPILLGGAVVMAAGVGIITMMTSGDETSPPSGANVGPGTETAEEGGGAAVEGPVEGGGTPAGSTVDSSMVSQPEGSRAAQTDPGRRDPVPDPPRGSGGGDPANPAGPTTSARFSEAEARALLERQFDRLGADPGPATFAVVTDSARLVWEVESLPDSIRALAAYVRGDGLFQAGRAEEARTWLQRAVQLAPDNEGYRSMLRLVGGGS